jgi:prevent-host-death family protein
MRIAPLATVKARLSAYLEECKEEGPIVITRNGKAVAVLLAPIDDDDLEGLLLARSPRFQTLLDKSRASIQAGKGLSSRQFWDAAAKRQEEQASGKGGSRSRKHPGMPGVGGKSSSSRTKRSGS